MKDTGSNRGFTFLEIMIALALVGSVLVTILYTVNYHSALSYEDILMTEMYLLAKEKIVEMELNPADSKGDIPGTDFNFVNSANTIPDTKITELKTVISGKGKKVVLKKFIVRK